MKLVRLKPTITREQLSKVLFPTSKILLEVWVYEAFKNNTFEILKHDIYIDCCKINKYSFFNSKVMELFEVIETKPQKEESTNVIKYTIPQLTDKEQKEFNSRLKLAYIGLLLFFIVALLFKIKVIG